MKRIVFFSVLLLPLIFAGKILTTEVASAEDSDATVLVADREYIGVDRCKICHRKEEDGDQYGKWLEGPHAKAYETLGTAEAKAVGAKQGVANPQESGECLQCHVTAYGVSEALLGSKYAITDGVGCESCHGAGGDYYKKSTMEGISAGEIDGASVGLITPTEATCRGCHNDKSPSFKGFDFAAASKKIAHPKP